MWLKKFKWNVEAPQDLNKYLGHHVRVTGDDGKERVIEIESIVGSMVHPTKFQLFAKGEEYLISMLDFFGQLNGEKFSKEEIALFDETSFQVRQTPRLLRSPYRYLRGQK